MSFRAVAALFRTATVIAAAETLEEIEQRALRAMAQLGLERCRIDRSEDGGRSWQPVGEYSVHHD